MLRSCFLRCVTVVAALAATPAVCADDALPPSVRSALAAAALPPQALYAVALPLDDGPLAPPRWAHQAAVPVQPGSAMKLVTAIVALERLGADARGGTEIRSAARLDADGVLHGDLVLRGGGDPELGVPQFWALLAELRARGVREVRGDLLLDRTRWRPARADLGVPPFDDAPEFPYNGIPDALQLAANLLPLRIDSRPAVLAGSVAAGGGAAAGVPAAAAVAAGTVAAPAPASASASASASTPAPAGAIAVTTVPPLDGLVVVSRQTLVDAPCADWDDGWRPAVVTADGARTVVELHGTFPRDCTQRVDLQLVDRTRLAGHLFGTLWRQLGGRWEGFSAREAAAPADAVLLARRTARPWGEVLRTVNKQSDNPLSRMLFLALGVPAATARPDADTDADTDTARRAAEAVRQWFAAHGIDAQGLVLDNGSGLSRRERISPLQLAQALRAAHRAPYASDLLATLPVAGTDGTLRRRLRDSPAAGRARLKTGTLFNAVALAGYLDDPDGRRWAVALMVNHDTAAARGRPVLDALVDHWVRHGMAPPRAAPGVGPLGDGP